MKKYLENEINTVKKYLKNEINTSYNDTININEFKEATETCFLLSSIYTDIIYKTNFTNRDKLKKLFDTDINQDIISIIKNVANFFATIPLLETESTISYPSLSIRRNIKDNDIIMLLNCIYTTELPKTKRPTFNSNNIKIFNISFLKSLFISPTCFVYHNYYKKCSCILLEKFRNIRAFTVPCSVSVELIPDIEFVDYNNSINIMSYFMKNRMIDFMSLETNYSDCLNLRLINTDALILKARRISKLLEQKNWDLMNGVEKATMIDFFDEIISIELAKNNEVHLIDLLNEFNDDNSMFDFNKFNISENSIIKNAEKVKSIRLKI